MYSTCHQLNLSHPPLPDHLSNYVTNHVSPYLSSSQPSAIHLCHIIDPIQFLPMPIANWEYSSDHVADAMTWLKWSFIKVTSKLVDFHEHHFQLVIIAVWYETGLNIPTKLLKLIYNTLCNQVNTWAKQRTCNAWPANNLSLIPISSIIMSLFEALLHITDNIYSWSVSLSIWWVSNY